MTDQIIMNANQPEEAGLLDELSELHIPLAPARPLHIRCARHISNILSPASISLPMILLVAFYQAHSVSSALWYAAITLFFLSVGPFGYILLNVHLGKLSDVDVSKRSERVGPFIFGLISACLGWFVLILAHAPGALVTMVMISALSGLVLLVITLWWKISMHASSLAGAATMLTAFYGSVMLPLFGLLLLVSWSRVVLRRHTIAQVIAGSLLSITLSMIILKMRGW